MLNPNPARQGFFNPAMQNMTNPWSLSPFQNFNPYMNPYLYSNPILPQHFPITNVTPVAQNQNQNQNLDLSILDQPNAASLQYTPDIRRTTSISIALEKRKISFSGKPNQDPLKFLKELYECLISLGLSEDELLRNLSAVLKAEALEWFRLKRHNFSTFNQFRTPFKSQYAAADYQTRLLDEAFART